MLYTAKGATCIFLRHQQMSWVGSFLSRAELETPHVTNHCCGVERLLQRKSNNEISRTEENLLANFGQIRIWMATDPPRIKSL